MTYKSLILTSLAIFSLAACDSGKKEDSSTGEEAAPAAETSTVEQVKETVVEKIKEMVKLDTSSVEAFKNSLSDMKDSLSDEDKAKLTSALANLAKKAVEEKSEGGGVMDIAKSAVSGGSIEDQLYDNFGDKLSGMSFDDILNYAK